MTGVAWFNAGTVVVVVCAAAGLVRFQVAEWRAAKFAARRAATTGRPARSPRLAPGIGPLSNGDGDD